MAALARASESNGFPSGETAMKLVSRTLVLFSPKAFLVAALAVTSAYLSQQAGLAADLPLTLIATAVIFPIVFSISGAYKRRETALDHYATLKAHGRALHLAPRDWLEAGMGRELMDRSIAVQTDLFTSTREMFVAPVSKLPDTEKRVYQSFDQLSLHIRALREAGIGASEISRCNQYMSKMLVAFERLKHIFQYRTPVTLRAFSSTFIVVLPIVYGPYFAGIASETTPFITAIAPALFSLVLVALAQIQDHLENPFDQVGEDDVMINVEKYIANIRASSSPTTLSSTTEATGT
jgi:hypothetical protein